MDEAAVAALIEKMLEQPDTGLTRASAPLRSSPADYTMFLVREAIGRYESEGLDATGAYYNTKESVDGQWYVFIFDENDNFVAHAANPALVGEHVSKAVGPNAYPAGSAVAGAAEQGGAWFDLTFLNPASGAVETKHSWMVIHDGITFGSGWYERGPAKSDCSRLHQGLRAAGHQPLRRRRFGGDWRLLQHEGEHRRPVVHVHL